MPHELPIDSLPTLTDDHLEGLRSLVAGPAADEDRGHTGVFIAELVRPIDSEIKRRADGWAPAPATAPIEHLADVEDVLLPHLQLAYWHLGRMLSTVSRFGEYPAAISDLLKREQMRRQALYDAVARSR